jgi:hypothetical protein
MNIWNGIKLKINFGVQLPEVKKILYIFCKTYMILLQANLEIYFCKEQFLNI